MESNISLALINCKQRRDERLTPFIYKEGETMTKNCNAAIEHCRASWITDQFSSQIYKEKITR